MDNHGLNLSSFVLYMKFINCKFGNFHETYFLQIFDFPNIREFFNSRASTCAVYKSYSNSLLARTLFLHGKEFTNISEN